MISDPFAGTSGFVYHVIAAMFKEAAAFCQRVAAACEPAPILMACSADGPPMSFDPRSSMPKPETYGAQEDSWQSPWPEETEYERECRRERYLEELNWRA